MAHPDTRLLLAKTVIASLLVLAAAGCKSKSACEKNGAIGEVAGDHEHDVAVQADHIARRVGGTYSLSAEPGHSHVIHLTDADMAKLAEGGSLTTRASSVNGHTHEVGLSCKE